MKQIWAIFLRDIKNIGKNPVAVIVALGIMILPSLYAWFNIAANWDPYGNTKGLRVAVASLDQGTRIEQLDTTVNIGDMIISNPVSSFRRTSARRRPASLRRTFRSRRFSTM